MPPWKILHLASKFIILTNFRSFHIKTFLYRNQVYNRQWTFMEPKDGENWKYNDNCKVLWISDKATNRWNQIDKYVMIWEDVVTHTKCTGKCKTMYWLRSVWFFKTNASKKNICFNHIEAHDYSMYAMTTSLNQCSTTF